MEALDAFLRTRIEPLQYVAFFGAMGLFGLAEAVVARSARPSRRRRRWPLNYGLTALNILIIGALPVSGVVVADYAQDAGIGLFNWVDAEPLVALVIGFLFRSFLSWAMHLAMHRVPILWNVHRVHHTDTFLDVSTTVRFHPVEFLINTPVLIGASLFMGIPPVALMLYEVFDTTMNVFTHANVRVPRRLERALRLVFVTPDMHRVHHSSFYRETDSNYGATLSIWDHIFGTYRDKNEEGLAVMELGLKECQDARSDSAVWLLKLPFTPTRIAKAEKLGRSPVNENAKAKA